MSIKKGNPKFNAKDSVEHVFDPIKLRIVTRRQQEVKNVEKRDDSDLKKKV